MTDAARVLKEDRPGSNYQLAPDPTERTLDQSRREILMLRELIESKLSGKDELSGLIKEFNAAVITHIRLEAAGLKELEDEKFKGINGQFSQRDLALTAALQAQKESAAAQQAANTDSIQKSEGATMKQLESLLAMVKAVEKVLADNTGDLKDRIQASESRTSERITALESGRHGSLGATTTAIAVMMLVVIFVGLIVDIALHFIK